MASLEFKNVTKTIANKTIIENLNLKIEAGEMLVIVGPSGCGKSTLLRMVAGLEEVSKGEIFINEKMVNRLEPAKRDIAMVFQNYALYPHMTVYKNLAYGLKQRKLSKTTIAEKIDTTATMLGIENLLDRKPKALSGGQRQRVAMGRAIVRDPVLYLFDEPLSNLDAKLRSQMRLEIRKLQKALNTTTLYVTHDQVEAMTMADKIVLLNHGRIEQCGTPHELYHQPKTMFVAGFMGSPSMNFLKANFDDNTSAVHLHGGTVLPLGMQFPNKYAGKELILGVRPESIIKANKPGADVFCMTIDMVEILGGEKLLYGHLPGDEQRLIVRVPEKVPAKIGENVALGVMPDSLHLFDIETQFRIIAQ